MLWLWRGRLASPTPQRPVGLVEGLSLNDFQQETVGWMLKRETSNFGIEDLFESDVADKMSITSLPVANRYGGQGYSRIACCNREIADVAVVINEEKKQRHFGGILGEEMGTGKTVEMISLILLNPPPVNFASKSNRRNAGK